MKKIPFLLALSFCICVFFLSGCACKNKKTERIEKVVIEKIPGNVLPPEKSFFTGDETVPTNKDEKIKNMIAFKQETKPETGVFFNEKEEKTKSVPSTYKSSENTILSKKDEKVPVPDEKEEKKHTEKIYKFMEYITSFEGECLLYEAKWNFITVGKGLLLCKEEKNGFGEVFHFVGITVPLGTFANLGYGYNRVDSFIDKKTLTPYYFYSYSKSGKKEKILEIFFDFKNKEYTWKQKKYKNGVLYSTKSGKVDFKGTLFDAMYVFYAMRSEDFENSIQFQFPVAMVGKIWKLKVKVKGKMIQSIPIMGNKEVFLLEPIAESDEGIFTKGKMDIWITADQRRVPVYIEGKIALGTAKLSLLKEHRIDPDLEINNEVLYSLLNME